MSAEWLIVVNATDTILAVDGGAPATWVGTQAPTEMPNVRRLVLDAVPLRRVATDVHALLESVLRLMDQQARAMEAALTLDVASAVPASLHLDPEKTAWMVSALVGNALRFVKRGTRLMPGGSIQIHARWAPEPPALVLEVKDDGSGIPEDKLPALLKPAPGQMLSTGLALTLVQDIVAAHGGSVAIESRTEAGHSGTTVRLTIPCR